MKWHFNDGYFRVNVEKYRMKVKLDYDGPVMLLGDYRINGKVLLLPIFGAGRCNITLGEVTLLLIFILIFITRCWAYYCIIISRWGKTLWFRFNKVVRFKYSYGCLICVICFLLKTYRFKNGDNTCLTKLLS